MFSSSTKIFTELCYLNKNLSKILCSLASLPVRGAWIEMVSIDKIVDVRTVAPRKGSVD